MSKNLEQDVNFLFEMGNIRHIQRMWQRFNTPQLANLAEHHFRVFWIALVIASREGNADTGKIAKMAILHDIAESRTGDVDLLSRQYVERNEELGIQDILEGTELEKEFYALWQEYEARDSLEAKIVKDADNLDVDFELTEQAATGSTLSANTHETREFVAANKLYTKTARELYSQLKEANPHAWWRDSRRNRRNSGNWRK
ncbi:MAG TPA: HD domain-containing protein [Candidatus Saccharimonadales bacterium]|jgi:putative hydrolase of HD superfamily